MFKAFNRENKKDVILLDPFWIERLDHLRSLDDRDALVCPGCLQPVRVRAGRTRRWHFAHKHLENCPFEQTSPELLAARAVLYGWLVAKFNPASVTIEKILPESGLSRPIDCWVEQGDQRFAYWIITHRLAPDVRERLSRKLKQPGIRANWVLHINLLQPQLYHANRLNLTTTEREFIRFSDYDVPYQERCSEPAGSLHYLDPERETLTTYRGLCRIHAPQLYRGHPHRSRLDDLLVSLDSGVFVHQGEDLNIERHRQEQAERKIAIERMQATLRQAASAMQSSDEQLAGVKNTPRTSHQPQPEQPPPEMGLCIFCGQMTSDWWYFNRATGECKCRACYRSGLA
jgi:Competence protein CoiA-like family